MRKARPKGAKLISSNTLLLTTKLDCLSLKSADYNFYHTFSKSYLIFLLIEKERSLNEIKIHIIYIYVINMKLYIMYKI